MSFLDDANAFMKAKKQEEKLETDKGFLVDEKSVEQFANELRSLYENATWQEIYKAIDWIKETQDAPYDKNTVMKKIRVRLED